MKTEALGLLEGYNNGWLLYRSVAETCVTILLDTGIVSVRFHLIKTAFCCTVGDRYLNDHFMVVM